MHDASMSGGVWDPSTTSGVTAISSTPLVRSTQENEYEWGVGKPANIITIMPIVDSMKTGIGSGKGIKNHPDGIYGTPLRATPDAPLMAFSKRLLRAMHHSKVTMVTQRMPEKLAASISLQHGPKAVVCGY